MGYEDLLVMLILGLSDFGDSDKELEIYKCERSRSDILRNSSTLAILNSYLDFFL